MAATMEPWKERMHLSVGLPSSGLVCGVCEGNRGSGCSRGSVVEK